MQAITEIEMACLSAETSGHEFVTIPWPGWRSWLHLPEGLRGLFGRYREGYYTAKVSSVREWLIAARKSSDD